MDKAVTTGDWSDPCFVKAGEDFQQLIDLEPFQEGFLAAPWDGAGSGAAAQATYNGAIQLMGQWLPGTVNANSGETRAIGEGLGWFPFPAVTGAPGDAFDGVGGGNGFAVGKDAPPETVDFLHYLVSLDAANRWGALNSGILPTTNGSEASTTDPMLTLVLEGARRPSSSSSTSIRRRRLSSVGRSTRRSPPCTLGPGLRSRWPRPSTPPPASSRSSDQVRGWAGRAPAHSHD